MVCVRKVLSTGVSYMRFYPSMVKQPFYCGEDQKKYYQETKQKADRDKMNPVYKRFFDIEDRCKADRLKPGKEQ